MPVHVAVRDIYLVLTPRADGEKGFVLEAYETIPTGAMPPGVSTLVLGVPFTSVREALHILLAEQSLRADKVLALQQLGDALATWLFATSTDSAAVPSRPVPRRSLNPVGVHLHEQAMHLHQHQRLRVWICADEASLTWVPFESLEHNRCLPFPVKVVRGVREPALSSCASTRSPAELEVADKLRVMLVSANPDATKTTANAPHLPHLETHCQVLENALDPLKHTQELFMQQPNPAPEAIQAMLQWYNPHVLVFAGHGYRWYGREGLVCVRDGEPVEWPFPELTGTLQGIQHLALRLVVFIACQSFVAAPSLLAAGVPAVVAMQPLGPGGNFPADGVAAFAGPFFRTLAHHGPLIEAHTRGCQALEHHVDPAAGLMPTLWLATAEDRLFDDDPDNRRRARYLDALLGKPGVALCSLPGVRDNVPLAEVYVEQTLVMQHDGGPPTEVNLWDMLHEHRRVLVEAPVWAGESALCQWLTQQCVDATGWIPIFCRFRDLARSAKSLQQYLAQDYTAWLGLEDPHLAIGKWLYHQWQTGQALLIVDGVDEEGDPARRAQALAALTEPAGAFSPRVVLTSRPSGDGAAVGVQTLELTALTRPQMAQLVRRYGAVCGRSAQAEHFLQAMDQAVSEDVRHLATRPGYVIQMFAAYAEEGIQLTEAEELMRRVVLGRFDITGRVQPPLVPDEPSDKRQIAEALSFHLLVCQNGQPQTEEVVLTLVQQALVAAGLNDVYPERDYVTLLEDLCRNSGFLTRTADGTYAWGSPLWLQFFATCFIECQRQKRHDGFARWAVATSAGQARHTGLRCPLCNEPLPPCPHALQRAEWS